MSILIHNPYQKLFQRKNSTFPGASIYWSVVRYHDTHQRLFFKTKLEAMMYEHSSPVPAQGFFSLLRRSIQQIELGCRT